MECLAGSFHSDGGRTITLAHFSVDSQMVVNHDGTFALNAVVAGTANRA
jgi:hypothetical protein